MKRTNPTSKEAMKMKRKYRCFKCGKPASAISLGKFLCQKCYNTDQEGG